ncbi:UNVERIFIED_CONTAM: hypothetical protein HDU68_002534 [Siphonaria sp. JEL0065]|nr:hypothetical protein HDU68_002534 [Siphonaria sp. JEL0065]
MTLKIDGVPPSAAEAKEILMGLTIAATSTSSITSKSPAFKESEKAKKKGTMSSSTAATNSKRKSRRAIAIVEDVSATTADELFNNNITVLPESTPTASATNVSVFASSTLDSTPRISTIAGTATINPAHQGLTHHEPESHDLLMESMDERSYTPSSQGMSPTHVNYPNDPPLAATPSAAESDDEENFPMEPLDPVAHLDYVADFTSKHGSTSTPATNPPISRSNSPFAPSGLTNPSIDPPPKEDRSLSKYFDAHQDFVSSSTSNAGGRSSSSTNTSDDESERVLGTSVPSNSSFLVGGTDVSPPRVSGGAEVSPILNGVVADVPSPLRSGGSGRLGRIEEAAAQGRKKGLNNVGGKDYGLSTPAFRVQQQPVGKPNFPKMMALGNQFDTSQSSLSSSPAANTGFTLLAATNHNSSSSSSSSSSGFTPLSNTPANQRKPPIGTSLLGNSATNILPSSKQFTTTALKQQPTASTEWHKKMAQVHETARREAQVTAEEEERVKAAAATAAAKAESSGGGSSAVYSAFSKDSRRRQSGGFEEAMVISHLPPQKPLMATASGSIHSGSSGRVAGGVGSSSASIIGVGGVSGGMGTGVDTIGPYRRVYEFEPTVKTGDDESVRSRNVHVTYMEGQADIGSISGGGISGISVPNASIRRDGVGHSNALSRSLTLGNYRSLSNEVGLRGPGMRRSGNESFANVVDPSTGGVGGGGEMAPRLILARPVANAMTNHQRRLKADDSEAGSDMSGSVYSAFPRQSNRTVAGSIFSGDSGGFSVFSGMTSLSRASGMPSFPNRSPPHTLTFPRAPNIPFLSINNSLQLHLKFKVFANDQEKILAWVAGSVVPQVAPYIQGITANAAASSESFLSSFLPSTSSDVSQDPATRATIARMQTVERASYLLLTDKGLYIFTPTFQMPYDPFSKGNANSATASAAAAGPAASSHLSNVIAQVRYDDPSRILKLARKIPLSHLARMDVGPNRQFLGIHFLTSDDVSASGEKPGNPALRRVSGIGVEGSLKSGGKGQQPIRKKASLSLGQNPLSGIRSLVFLTRDRSGTSRILDALIPVLYESKANSKFTIRGDDGKVKIVNQDVEWSLTALRDKVLLKTGEAHSVVLNDVDLDGKVDWRDVVAKRGALAQLSQPEKKSWFSDLLNTPLSSSGRSSGGTSVVATEPIPSRKRSILNELDYDPATSSTVVLNKVNFEFLKLYLLVGWIVPHKPPPPAPPKAKIPPSLSVTVNSVSLIATRDYIYLTSERFDVWPPPLFPASTLPTPSVNAPLLEHASSLVNSLPFTSPSTNAANGSSTPPPPARPLPDPFKGLSATQIPQYSPPLRVGRVRDLVRCERWKTWRWKLGPHVTQVEEASLLEQKVAALVQNGAIGVVRVVEDEWPIGGVKPSGSTNAMDKARRAGATSGWDWWVRIVFKESEGSLPLDSPSISTNEGSCNNDEYFWDIVFATLDAANEFLEFVKDVRGVKPVHETEDMAAASGFENDELHLHQHESALEHTFDGDDGLLSTSPRGEEFEDIDFARDSRLFDKVAWDGVGLVIGDD